MTIAQSHDPIILLKVELEAEPWKGICNRRCYAAKTDKTKCKCHCQGMHHGKEQLNKPEENRLDGFC